MLKINIITGSTRPNRFNIQPSEWIYDIAKKRTDVETVLTDLEAVNLPFLDEAMPPMMHQYTKDHTKKWSEIIAASDGFIVVTPEYNHSTSAVLKNAFDYLNAEWSHKPVSFISYGSMAGGARAVEHLRGIAGELKMYDLREQVLLPNYWQDLDDKGQYKFNEHHEHAAEGILTDLTFWARIMKQAREELSKKSS